MLKKAFYSFVLCTVAAAAFLAGSIHDSHSAVTAAATVEHRAPASYRCPMHPTYTSERAGDCPICGMTLERVSDAAATPGAAAGAQLSPDAVVVSARQLQLIGVRVGTFETTSGVERVRLFGRVTVDESRVRKLTAGVNGFTRETFEATTGSYVRRGQVLATYSTIEMRQPIGALISALDVLDREQKNGLTTPGQVGSAAGNVELTTERLLTLGVSPTQIADIRRTRAVPNLIHVVSPIDGFVVARNINPGQKLDAGMELFQIADLQHVWILADIPADAADRVTPGAAADVTVGGRTIPARVSSKVLPQFDRSTQSFKVRIDTDNTGFALRPDMFVDVHLDMPYEATLAVPSEAIVRSGLRSTVFVERGAGVFEPRQVQTGRRIGDRVAIVSGLEPGERIVLSGTFLLDSESRMKRHD